MREENVTHYVMEEEFDDNLPSSRGLGKRITSMADLAQLESELNGEVQEKRLRTSSM